MYVLTNWLDFGLDLKGAIVPFNRMASLERPILQAAFRRCSGPSLWDGENHELSLGGATHLHHPKILSPRF